MDDFARHVTDKYGPTFYGELAFSLVQDDKPTLVDNQAGEVNVRFLQDKGFYVVGLACSFENQMKRRLENTKQMDPTDCLTLERQIHETNHYFEIVHSLPLAHVRYNTDDERSDSARIVGEVVRILRG